MPRVRRLGNDHLGSLLLFTSFERCCLVLLLKYCSEVLSITEYCLAVVYCSKTEMVRSLSNNYSNNRSLLL